MSGSPGGSTGVEEMAGPRRVALGCAHWTIFILTALVLALVTTPLLAIVVGGLQSALGAGAPATKDVVFYGWIPALAGATIWSSRRINRWLDRRVGRADNIGARSPGPPSSQDEMAPPPPARMSEAGPRTILEDPGAAQLGCFLGWVPPAIAAVISGIVVGIASASLLAFAVVAVAGTVVGYVVCLVSLFTVGAWFEKRARLRRLGARAAEVVYWTMMLSGVPAAIAVALLVSGLFAR
jgi:hypothetical protein